MIYDGFDFSDLLKVETPIGRSILPPIEASGDSFSGMPGQSLSAVGMDALELTVPVRIIAPFKGDAEQKMGFEHLRRVIAGHLWKSSPRPLVLDDAPDVYYMAVLSGTTELERFRYTGGANLVFLCTDPVAYGKRHVKSGAPNEELSVRVGGTWTAFPNFEFDVEGYGMPSVTFDGAAFNMYGHSNGGPVTVNSAERYAEQDGEAVTVDILSDYPQWEPGVHTVVSSTPFTVEWNDRWL